MKYFRAIEITSEEICEATDMQRYEWEQTVKEFQ